MLVLAAVELIFFIADRMGLCFEFVLETVLVTQGCFNYSLYSAWLNHVKVRSIQASKLSNPNAFCCYHTAHTGCIVYICHRKRMTCVIHFQDFQGCIFEVAGRSTEDFKVQHTTAKPSNLSFSVKRNTLLLLNARWLLIKNCMSNA